MGCGTNRADGDDNDGCCIHWHVSRNLLKFQTKHCRQHRATLRRLKGEHDVALAALRAEAAQLRQANEILELRSMGIRARLEDIHRALLKKLLSCLSRAHAQMDLSSCSLPRYPAARMACMEGGGPR